MPACRSRWLNRLRRNFEFHEERLLKRRGFMSVAGCDRSFLMAAASLSV